MKRFFVFVFALIIGTGFSQADGEMKYLNRNKIEYNGDKINLKKAMELSKGVSEDANTYFRNAKRCNISNGGYLLSNTLALGALVSYLINPDKQEGMFSTKERAAVSFFGLGGVFVSGFYQIDINSKEKTDFLKKGVLKFNEAKKGS
tara:strand:+ start:40 stop:480 length:441 start_codon:yes stop_codon:yes gene_type:complete